MNKELLNTCIKSTSPKHGAKIVKFYKDNGFGTKPYSGDSYSSVYYGVNVDGYFNSASDSMGRTVITLPEDKDWAKATKEEIMNETIRRYPIGSKVKLDREFTISTKYKFAYKSTPPAFMNTPFYFGSNNNVLAVRSDRNNGECIFRNGIWADVISTPETEEIPKPIVDPKTYKVTREQFAEMHKVACSGWKSKIENLVDSNLGKFKSECELSKYTVDGINNALFNDEQRKLFNELFPDYLKEKDKNPFIYKSGNSKAIGEISNILFDNRVAFELLDAGTPEERPELRERAFFVHSDYEVKTGPAYGGGTYIELVKK